MEKKIELYLITSLDNLDRPVRSWVDITQYVEQGLTINDSCSGTFDSGSLVLTLPEDVILSSFYDVSKPIPPRTPIRISEYNNPEDTEFQVSYIFETSDVSQMPERTAQTTIIGADNKVTYLYTHEINYVELTKDTEGKYPPSLSVRQPKNIYDLSYKREVGITFDFASSSMKFADGHQGAFTADSSSVIRDLNNSLGNVAINALSDSSIKITTTYDNNGVPITGIANEDYTYYLSLKLKSTAPQYLNGYGPFNASSFVYVVQQYRDPQGPRYYNFLDYLTVAIGITATYYDNSNNVIDSKFFLKDVKWRGDSTFRTNTSPLVVEDTAVSSEATSVVIPKNSNAAKVVLSSVYIPSEAWLYRDIESILFQPGRFKNNTLRVIKEPYIDAQDDLKIAIEAGKLAMVEEENAYALSPNPVRRNIAFKLVSMDVSLTSTLIQETVLDKYRTLYDVVMKAINEINLRNRVKYTLSRRLTALLESEKAPEWTLEDYNLKEVLLKACRIVHVVPILGDTDLLDNDEDPLTTISYVKPGEQAYDFTLDSAEYTDLEKSNTLDEYFDIISARLKNCISEEDSHREDIIIQATDTDYSAITQDNAGFVTSYPIYWLKWLTITGLGIPYTYVENGSPKVAICYGNRPKYAPDDRTNQYWDFTSRCFEEDIYNALPDVNYSTEEGRKNAYLSKGNSISYKSGTQFIKNLGHQAPNLPDYDPPFTSALEIVANLALVECAVVLAYQAFKDNDSYPGFSIAQELDITITSLFDVQAHATFVSLDEFTYRNFSQDERKIGKLSETRVVAQDKVLSYKDVVGYVGDQQKKQGNIIVSPTLIYPNITTCLKTGYKLKDNYVITTRKLKIFNEYVECSYELTKNFVIQSDDIKLNIEYERYAVPYDFVWREVNYSVHVILSTWSDDLMPYVYDDGRLGATAVAGAVRTFDEYADILTSMNGAVTPSEAYAVATMSYLVKSTGAPLQSDRKALVKLHMVRSGTSLSYIGRFVDNYSAGNQTFLQSSYNYSQPFRYCDSLGKVRKLGVDLYRNVVFQPRNFPDASHDITPSGQLLSCPFSELVFTSGDDKDAREGYEFNFAGYLETADNLILVFNTGYYAEQLWVLTNDPTTLDENTRIEDLRYSKAITFFGVENGSYPLGPQSARVCRSHRLKFEASDFDPIADGKKPIAIVGKDLSGNYKLNIILLGDYSPESITFAGESGYQITFYSVTTMLGQWNKI